MAYERSERYGMGLLRLKSTLMKCLAGEPPTSADPNEELLGESASIPGEFQRIAERIDRLAADLNSITDAISILQEAPDEYRTQTLQGTVVGLGERVHIHEEQLRDIRF